MDANQIFIGINVSKDKLDVHVRPADQSWSTANEGKAVAVLVARLAELKPTLIVLEATGGLERRALAQLLPPQWPLRPLW